MVHASHHYVQKIKGIIKYKDFLKNTYFSNLDDQLILVTKISKKPKHDIKDFMPLWNKIKHLDFQRVLADKAYDSNSNHQAVFEANKKSVIFLKNIKKPIHLTSGIYRKKAKKIEKYQKKVLGASQKQ